MIINNELGGINLMEAIVIGFIGLMMILSMLLLGLFVCLMLWLKRVEQDR